MRRPLDDQAPPMARGEVRLPPDAHVMTPTQPAAPVAAPAPEREELTPVAPAAVEHPRPAAVSAPVAQPAPRPLAPAPAAVRPIQPLPPAAPRPVQPLTPVAPRAPATPPAPVAARPAVTPMPLRPAAPASAPAPRPAPPKAVNDQPPSLDEALLEELEVTLDRTAAAESKNSALPASVEDEMEKLLGDLARPRR
jgi:hypothetical protein